MNYKILPAKEIKERFQKQLSTIRTGRVNATVLEHILVDAYGSKMHFHELATITVPEPAQLLITPFDKSLIGTMSRSISESNLGVTPFDDGAGIRLNFPPLTEENKKIRVKEVHKLQEEARIDLRQKRQDLLKAEKRKEEDGQISKDDLTRFESDLQKEVDELNKEIETITKAKEDELMKI